jgi:GH15 family glucan-1,4-alpha-glucosidase
MMKAKYRTISDYGIIGDCYSCALISSNGSIDWACFPRFDSPSVFGRLLDKEKGGFFEILPKLESKYSREYIQDTNVLLTTIKNEAGEIKITDFMPMFNSSGKRVSNHLIRIIECMKGEAKLDIKVVPKFNYSLETPVLEFINNTSVKFVGKKESLILESDVPTSIEDASIFSSISMKAGEKKRILLTHKGPETNTNEGIQFQDCENCLERTIKYWEEWAQKCTHQGKYRDLIIRSTLALKLMTYEPTGAFVAAPTTSLPEEIGGVRNWDYRFTWLRDASLTVDSLLATGHQEEALAYQDWVCHIANICKEDLQIVYGLGGERVLEEKTLDHLEGYEESRPVRIGNEAYIQFQLDTFGEILDCVHLCRQAGFDKESSYWNDFYIIVDWVCHNWQSPDKGIWEIRSEPKQFVHSKVMAWVALDRGIKAAEELDLPCPNLQNWKKARNEIYSDIMAKGWSDKTQSFTQHYEVEHLDASNLRISLVGFIPHSHPKMVSTVNRTLEKLTKHKLVYRYLGAEDGIEGGESTFAICTFWLIENLAAQGRYREAEECMERILSCLSDLKLLAEEIEPVTKRQLGNFPQAFSHIGLIRAAMALEHANNRAIQGDNHEQAG